MKTENLLSKLKSQETVSRDDINELLKSVGKPGEKRDEKVKVVGELGLTNPQGHDVADSLADYGAF